MQKHGTCSGLTQKDYFRAALQVFSTFPTADVIQNNVGGSVDLRSIQAAYNATNCGGSGTACYTAIQCSKVDNVQYFSSIVSCWSKDLQQISCPGSVIQKVCSAGAVKIRGF